MEFEMSKVVCLCRKKDIKEKLVNQWLDDDFEWPRPNTPAEAFKASKSIINKNTYT